MISALEQELVFQLKALKVPMPVLEFRFAADIVGPGPGVRDRLNVAGLKDWRFDMAWPAIKFAVEIEGATPQGGRHQRMLGFIEDIEKYHTAMDLGWNLYRTSGPLIADGRAVQLIEKLLTNSGSVDGDG